MNARTIAAISTPIGIGGIAIIRISGCDAVEIVSKIYKGTSDLKNAPTHTVHHGYIAGEDGETIDEVLVTIMRAPKSFTGEDVVEIGTHGGIVASKRVLKCLIKNGAYMAEAGEFTKRAFLNGKIDLSEAEGIIDIINAKNETAQKNAMNHLSGKLSEKIEQIRQNLIKLAASMQVIIDYPDEELEDVSIEDIKETAEAEINNIKNLIESAKHGKIITNGILTAIVGRPNVGKSSLLNALAGEDRAIVTDVAGTTRDVIEELVDLDGVMLRLMDTAGIRNTDDTVEKIGVMRSYASIDKADLVLVVLDASEELKPEDYEILEKTNKTKRIILNNKADVKRNCNLPKEGIDISAKTGEGIDKLAAFIKQMYEWGRIEKNDEPIITNMRHTQVLYRAETSLQNIVTGANNNMPADILSIDLNDAIAALGEITGAVVSDDIVAEIFHNFCVGK